MTNHSISSMIDSNSMPKQIINSKNNAPSRLKFISLESLIEHVIYYIFLEPKKLGFSISALVGEESECEIEEIDSHVNMDEVVDVVSDQVNISLHVLLFAIPFEPRKIYASLIISYSHSYSH